MPDDATIAPDDMTPLTVGQYAIHHVPGPGPRGGAWLVTNWVTNRVALVCEQREFALAWARRLAATQDADATAS